MITAAILKLLGNVFGWLASWLPESDIDLPAGMDSLGDKLGEYMGPADGFLPVSETALFLQIVVGVWMPAAAIYTMGMWMLAHNPFVKAAPF